MKGNTENAEWGIVRIKNEEMQEMKRNADSKPTPWALDHQSNGQRRRFLVFTLDRTYEGN